MPATCLRHRDIEVWIEDSNGQAISLSEDAVVDLHKISTWVNMKPRQRYTLRWRNRAGRTPPSALCEVFVEDGFYSSNDDFSSDDSSSDDFDSSKPVSISIIDAKRRKTHYKSTKGWLNSPYSRFGCLRIPRRLQAFKKTQPEPGILSLGSARLELRRVSGHIRKDQVYWRKADGICVFNPDGVEVIDDAARGKSPFIIFEFKFREDPTITQLLAENEESKIGIRATRKSSKSSTLALPAIGKAENTPGVAPSAKQSTSSLPVVRGCDHLKAKQKLLKESGMLVVSVPAPGGSSTHTSSLPQARGEIVSNVNVDNQPRRLIAPVAAPLNKVLDYPPSSSLTATKMNLKSAKRPPPLAAPTDGIPTTNPRVQIGHSIQARGEVVSKINADDNQPRSVSVLAPVTASLRKDPPSSSSTTEISTESAKPPPPPTDGPTTNPRVQIGHSLQARGETVSKINVDNQPRSVSVLAPVTASLRKDPPSSSSTTEISTETAKPPPPAPTDGLPTTNPRVQIGHSLQARGETVSNANVDNQPHKVFAAARVASLDHPPSPSLSSTEIIISTESVILPPPAPADRVPTTNSRVQIGNSDSELEGRSLTTTEDIIKTETIFGIEPAMPTSEPSALMDITTVCEPETVPLIDEVTEGASGDRALTVPATSNPAEVVLEKGPDIVELTSPSGKGKRKMIDREDDSIAQVPAPGEGGSKRNRITMVEEEDSDIEYIGSWRPPIRKTRTKITQTAVKVENVPIKLENPVSDSALLPKAAVTVKPERLEIKLEDNQQLGRKCSIDEMMENFDALERKKEELKQKLVVKMESRQREIEELLRRLDD